MRFSVLLSFIAGLAVYTSGHTIGRKAFSYAEFEDAVLIENEEVPCPTIPSDASPDFFHVVLRVHPRPEDVPDKDGVKMDGYRDLIKKMGGHHDVLIGKKTGPCLAFDLRFVDRKKWKTFSNGDNAPIRSTKNGYKKKQGEKVTHQGKLHKDFDIDTALPLSSLLFFLLLLSRR